MKRRIIALALVLAVFAVTVDSAQACRHRRRCCVVKVMPYAGTFNFQTPYDFVANEGGITAQPATDKFTIKLQGNEAIIATFNDEDVKFTAICTVLLPASIKKAPSLKVIHVPMTAEFNAKGVAEFSKKLIYGAVKAELARSKFWDHPSLSGLENFNIKVTGVARVGSFIFKNGNCKVLTGTVK